ncbi:microsomal glutathione S-transferase 1-like [Synchiropus picturatus]
MAGLLEDQVFMAYTTYAAIVVVKMMLMSPLTAYFRITRKAFANEEDVAIRGKSEEEKKRMLRTNPDVERVRRCHLNDMENIIPFVFIGFFYSLTGPELSTALLHFRIFAGCRIFHTISYVGAFPQPCRGLSFIVGLLATFSMAYRVLSTILVL